MISIDDFAKLDLRVGKVVAAEAVPESNKLLKLSIDFGPDPSAQSSGQGLGIKTIFSGIRKVYAPETLIGKFVVVLVNLEPREMAGGVSEGMVLSAESEQGPVLLVPLSEVAPGSRIR